MIALGRALFGSGSVLRAANALEQCIAVDPMCGEAYRLLASLLVRRGIHTEALAVIERGIARGVDEGKLAKVRVRAQSLLDAQQTQVRSSKEVGIGNRSVAGTIGRVDSAEDPLGGGPTQITAVDRQRLEGAKAASGPDEQRTAESVPADAPSVAAGDEPPSDWGQVGDLWEQVLDSRRGMRVPESESDLRDPFGRRALADIELPPLEDPLASGMPPLPPDEQESGGEPEGEGASAAAGTDGERGASTGSEQQSAGAEQRVAAEQLPAEARAEAGRLSPAAPAQRPASDRGAETGDRQALGAGGGSLGADEPTQPGRTAGPSAQRGPRQPTQRAAEASEPPRADPRAANPPPPSQLLEQLVDASIAAGEPTGSGIVGVPETVASRRRRGGRRRGRKLVALCSVALVASGGLVGGQLWRERRAAARAKRALSRARSSLLPREIAKASSAIEAACHVHRLRSCSELAAEKRLLGALAALLGSDKAAEPGKEEQSSGAGSWSATATRAARALARGRLEQAERLLRAVPKTRSDRALRLALLGYRDWFAGDRQRALVHASKALRLQPGLSLATLVRALVALDFGEVAAANRQASKILERDPAHPLAIYVRAVVAASGRKRGETAVDQGVDRWLRSAAGGPAVRRRRELAVARRAVSAGEGRGGDALTRLAAGASRELWAPLARALSLSCRFEQASSVIDRFAGVARGNVLESALRAEVAMARGAFRGAIKQLSSPALGPAQRLLRARALIRLGRLSGVERALEGVAEPAGQRYRILAVALSDPAALDEEDHAAALRALSPAALPELMELADGRGPAVGPSALLPQVAPKELSAAAKAAAATADARRALRIGQRERARRQLAGALRSCSGYLPAKQLTELLEARALLRAGRAKKARALAAKLQESSVAPQAQLTLAAADQALGHHERAAAGYRQLLERSAGHGAAVRHVRAAAHVGLFRLALGRDDPSEAREQLTAAIRADPDSGVAHRLLGELLLRGDPEAACLQLQRATEIDQRDVEALWLLGSGCRRQLPDAAKAALRRVVALDKRSARARRARRLLR